jgi:hypothetical protein
MIQWGHQGGAQELGRLILRGLCLLGWHSWRTVRAGNPRYNYQRCRHCGRLR